MRKSIRLLPLICLCLCLILPAHAQTAADKSYLVPKYISAKEENLPIYDGQLAEFREETLCMETDQIHTLEIDLADRLNVNAVRIFQVSTESFSPLWFAASWQGT